MAVEVAIRAFRNAERPVDVEGESRATRRIAFVLSPSTPLAAALRMNFGRSAEVEGRTSDFVPAPLDYARDERGGNAVH
jgi:hypothetical protein